MSITTCDCCTRFIDTETEETAGGTCLLCIESMSFSELQKYVYKNPEVATEHVRQKLSEGYDA